MRDTKQFSAALLSLRRPGAHEAGNSRPDPGAVGPSRQATYMPRLIACVLLLLIFAAYGIRSRFADSVKPARQGIMVPAVQSAITNPVSFAKSHVTGGIGAMLLADPMTGLPRIQMVVAGAPAQKAGLRAGDLILEIDGVTTRGQTLVQDIERIRGFAMGSVVLTIERAGSTNLNCVIHRTSWSEMGIRQ